MKKKLSKSEDFTAENFVVTAKSYIFYLHSSKQLAVSATKLISHYKHIVFARMKCDKDNDNNNGADIVVKFIFKAYFFTAIPLNCFL